MHRCKKLCEAFLLTTYIEPLESGTPTDRVMTQGPRFAHHDGCQILSKQQFNSNEINHYKVILFKLTHC